MTEELLESTPIWQARQRVGPRALFRLVQRIADRIELARFLREVRLELGGARRRFRELAHQVLDQDFRIHARLALIGDFVHRLHLRAVVGDGCGQIMLGGVHHAMQLLRDLVDDGGFGGLRSDIGRKQILVGRLVEFSLVADQNVDRALEVG